MCSTQTETRNKRPREVCPAPESFNPEHALNPAFVEYVSVRAANHWISRRSSFEADRASIVSTGALALLEGSSPARILAADSPYKMAKTIAWRAIGSSYRAAKSSRQNLVITHGDLDPHAKGLGLAQRDDNYCQSHVRSADNDEVTVRTVWKASRLNRIYPRNLDEKWEELCREIQRKRLTAQAKRFIEILLSDEEAMALGYRFGLRWLGSYRAFRYREIGEKLGLSVKQAERLVRRGLRILREAFQLEASLRYLKRNEAGEWVRRDMAKTDRFAVLASVEGRLIKATPLPTDRTAQPPSI